MTISELKEIALHAVKGTVPTCYANQTVDMNAAFADGLRDLAGSYNDFMRNRYDIFDIVIEASDAVLPKKVIDQIGQFAEVQAVPQGQKAIFKRRVGALRARQFITQAALSGVYETFRLDEETFTVNAHAVGGAVTIDFERMLDGSESLAECMQVLADGLVDAVYYEVHKALRAAISNVKRPSANKHIANTFDAAQMLKLMTVVKAYGNGVVIFAPPEFIAAMGPDAIVPAIANAAQAIYAPEDINDIHNTGRIHIFRGAPVVEIPQSFIDENNNKTWIDPQYAYIFPTGGEKVVKVVLEGDTQIREHENKDNSIEIHAWKKMGCAILTHNNWAIYQNTGITQTFENPYGF